MGTILVVAEIQKGAIAPGCIEATVAPEVETSASSLPLKMRRTNAYPPSPAPALMQSDTKAQSRPAAMRGATSQPDGVLEMRIRSAPVASAAALIALLQTSTL
jgi:hypothetical protein